MESNRNTKAMVKGPRQNPKKRQETTRKSVATVSKSAKDHRIFWQPLRSLFKSMPSRLPPAEVSSRIYDRKILYRFDETATSQSFDVETGHQQFMFAIASGLALCYSYIDAWRMKKITFYLLNNEAGESVRISLTPNGTDTANNFLQDINRSLIMYSQSDAVPNVFQFSPGMFHPSGTWHETNAINPTGSLFLLETSASIDRNTVFEIEYQYIMNSTGSPNGYTKTSTSAVTTGGLYASSWGSGSLITPIGINSCTF